VLHATFKMLQAIVSESMRRIKNVFRQKFCEFGNVIDHTIGLMLLRSLLIF